MTYPTCWHILSYPRSGNHAVRALLERYTGRPTLGCPENQVEDRPIYMRAKNKKSGLIEITDPRPIGRKAHRPREILFHDAQEDRAGVILITRDPVDAITSHLRTMPPPKRVFRKVANEDWTRRILAETDTYLALLYAFRSMTDRTRLHVRYKDIVNPKSGAAEKLLSAMGFPDIDTSTLSETLDLANESLQRPGRKQPSTNLSQRVKRVVSQFVTYDDVLSMVSVQQGSTLAHSLPSFEPGSAAASARANASSVSR